MFRLPVEVIRSFNDLNSLRVYDTEESCFLSLDCEGIERVRALEREYNALVYFIIRSYTKLVVMDSYLFVSYYPQEWQKDRQDVKDMEVIAYVYNRDDPELSEVGYIGVERALRDGLKRVW